MPNYYVDDGGDNSDGSTWAKAYTSLAALDTAVALASGDIVYIGHDHVDQATHAAHYTITGPSSGNPCIIISATSGSDPPTYAVATSTQQIDTAADGAYDIIVDGSFAFYGITFKSGRDIQFDADSNEYIRAENCTFYPAADRVVVLDSFYQEIINCTIDGTADGTTGRITEILRFSEGRAYVTGLNFTNVAYRTGRAVRSSQAHPVYVSGADFSGFTNATTCEILYGVIAGPTTLSNCKTKATPTLFTADAIINILGRAELYNVQNADDPTHITVRDYFGDLVSSTAIYRSSGASVESVATSWLVTTTAYATKDSPFYTPWIYGTIASTGNKTFTVYITNDTADFNNDEVWLEVEYMDTADVGLYTLVTDKIATRLTAAAAQTDDTTSTWNGTGPSFTYKQSLANASTVSVDETGQFRARVAIGKASIAGSAYFYIDPKITVS